MSKTKKTRYFEHYISAILKEVCPERAITQSAKYQLNELAITTCKLISKKILQIITKKTITEIEVEAAIKLVFDGQLCQKSIEEGKRCLQNYSNLENNENHSKKSKADLLIPPSMLEKFLRYESSYRVSANSPIFLAGIIEYFLAQVIELSSLSNNSNNSNNSNKKGIRITLSDIENGIESDKEIDRYLKQNNIYLCSKNRTEYVFPKTVIDDSIKNYMSLIYPEIRFQKDCFSSLHDYIEKWLMEILQSANHHSKKVRVSGSDIDMVLSILEKRHIEDYKDVKEECIVFTP